MSAAVMYQIRMTPYAYDDLESIADHDERQRVADVIDELGFNPIPQATENFKDENLDQLLRRRVRRWSILYQFSEQEGQVRILRITDRDLPQ